MNAPTFSRRQFTAGLGALVVAFSLDPKRARGQEPPRLPGSLQNNRKLDGWIRINADGTATIFSGKVELGQGILTALHQIAAEELDLPLERIKMISGDTGQTPNEGQTAGSQSVENSGTALRMAGAEVEIDAVDFVEDRNTIRLEIRKILEDLLNQEARIDQAARVKIESQKRTILEGSQEWDILYRKYYNEEVKKLGV